MVEEANTPSDEPAAEEPAPAETQAPAQKPLRLRMDQREMSTSYANMAITHSTPNEVLMDFGLRLRAIPTENQESPEDIVKFNDRIIMNYYSAKELAITLSKVVRRYEEQFGELELDVTKRLKGAGGAQ